MDVHYKVTNTFEIARGQRQTGTQNCAKVVGTTLSKDYVANIIISIHLPGAKLSRIMSGIRPATSTLLWDSASDVVSCT